MTYYVPARLAPGYRSILTHVELHFVHWQLLVHGIIRGSMGCQSFGGIQDGAGQGAKVQKWKICI